MDSLGDRMKRYEITSQNLLTRFVPVIIRIDGKAFHTFTRGLEKPFDQRLIDTMWATAIFLCEQIQGCKVAYIQSDEISLLLTDYETIKTEAWFDYNVQKMVSIAASIATVGFNKEWNSVLNFADICGESILNNDWAMFDARVFNLPKEEVCNYFIWRQQDATRNSIQGLAQANFSHKQLQNKNCDQLQELLFQEKDINWNDCATYQKRGACIVKKEYEISGALRTGWKFDREIPIFTQDRNYIEKYI
jgi:tRNA(His) guanylyltransferase